jgi:PTS system cellobiose-specific IIA component
MNEELTEISMKIILRAGNARALIKQALDLVAANRPADAEAKLEEARKEQTVAHETQTDIIQDAAEGKGPGIEYSLLFSHAQDTLMTVTSELMIAKQLLLIYRSLDKRISDLERN